ncbi:glycosyltransferase family 4 protein [Sphingobium phenoxybenzoativorans]|uniref:glycosyltransferase family 4 protein n=1 Tax=Sphingobium phenoxybenzoativorans TaxID=1592790 RepID=UPI00087314A7|nr:glycosyltransferase family 4 protein [Sphingobium phenoxybenzoativorans]
MRDEAKQSSRRPDVMMLGLRSFGHGQGGVEAHVEQLAQEVDRAGYAVEVVVRKPYAGEQIVASGRDIRTIPLWSPKGKSTEAIVHSIIGVLYAAWRRPRILHMHAIGPSLTVPLARLLGLRVVFTHHGEDFQREKWGWFARKMLRLGERFGALFSNERICVSSSLANDVSARYGVSFKYIPNGVRSTKPVSSTTILDKLDLKPGGYILHVGRIVPEKRQIDLIHALEFLDVKDMKLVLVGAADHATDYSKIIDEEVSGNRNVIAAGFQTGLALEELYSHAGIFALPSSHEGLPIALLEAMAFGCRVVASDIEANLNVGLPHGCYFKLADVSGLAGAIRSGLPSDASQNRVDWSQSLSNYDWSEIAAKTIEAYGLAARSGFQSLEHIPA